ncbi:MAG TPA: response regulator transcription factor [Lunatimonas sp.]|nr:response regulator transcription factor [Lunatimonas sp.]
MTKIIMADDHKMFAQGMANILKREPDFEIVGIFSNGKQVLSYLQRQEADLLITDMNMPGMDGIGLIQELKKRKIKIKIIVLSMYDGEEIFKNCVKQGISAYVLKNADPEELVYTIHEVIEKRHIIDFQHVLYQAEDNPFDHLDTYALKFKLSKREFEILSYIAKGKTNKEISEILHLSVHTVETHRKHIHAKLNVSSSAELIKKAIDMGLG